MAFHCLNFFNLRLDEFKGHSFLEAVKSGDLGKVKRGAEIVNFVHPLTMDTALVSFLYYFLSEST